VPYWWESSNGFHEQQNKLKECLLRKLPLLQLVKYINTCVVVVVRALAFLQLFTKGVRPILCDALDRRRVKHLQLFVQQVDERLEEETQKISPFFFQLQVKKPKGGGLGAL